MFVQGKTIAVTGAGKGIGRSCVEFFLEHGANVISLTRSKEDVLSLQKAFKNRNFGIFHEHVTNKILEDFIRACKPKTIEVTGDFNPRGGIKTIVKAKK